MKRIIGNLLALFLLLLVAVGCNNSTPNILGEITINEGYAPKVDIEDFTKGVELPKAGITAHYTNGNAAAVTSNISYSAAKDGVAISGLTAKEKGTYTITATYKEGEVSKSASYSVTVTGPARLFVSEMEGTDNYYSGDTYDETDIKATITYEDRYGKTNTVTPSEIIVSKEDGTVVANDTELTNGNYYIVFNYTDSDGAVLSTEKENFYVSAGLLPVGFDVTGDVTIPESINKEKKETLDLSGLRIKAYYEDGEKKADRELTLITDEGIVEECVILSLSCGDTTASYDDGISLGSFNKGDKATLTITVPKSFLKAVKKTDAGEVIETAYEGLEGELETTKEILITVNPTIEEGSLKVVTNESTEEVPYVENDTVELKNITFTYDDGTGAEPYTVSADTKGVVVKKGDETASSPFNLTLGENTISVTYNEAAAETTVEAVEAAKAVEITSIISALTTRYEVNSATETKISIPDEIRMMVKYEDDFEEEITVKDTSMFTFTLNWKTSLGINLLSEPITVTKDSPATLTTDNVGLYDMKITYSAPGDFTHRQAKPFTDNEKLELTCIYDEEIEIIQAAVIANLDVTNSTEEGFKEFVEGDVIKPSDVTFTFINIYGEKDTSKTNASDENFTLYINDSPVTDEGYTLTAGEMTYQVKYDDKAGVTATSEEKTISPLPLLTPVEVAINESGTLTETISMEDKIDTPYSIEKLSVTLTYADDETTVVNVIENGEIVDDSFTVTVGETPYGEFKYSYDASNLGEQTVTVTLENGKAHSKRQVKEVTETTADLDDTYSITIERDPIIKEAKYTLPEGKVVYNNSRINTSDISFIYVDNHGLETTIHGDNEEATCAINETQAADGILTIPAEGIEATINVSYKGVASTITIPDILADEPAKLLIEESAITTEYKATSPLFSETIADSIELEYLSEKVETIEKSELTFKLGDSTISTATNIVKENEGSSIDVYYGEYKVYTTKAINYNAVESLTVTAKENVPLAIVQTEEAIDAKAFVEKVTLVFEDTTEEDYGDYGFEVSGDTNALREMVTLTPSVTINGDTVVDSKNALTVQVVANEYERAGYDDALTIEANSEIAFSIPEIFNRTEDGESVFFLGYYDEEGTELTYGEGDIYVTTEGEAVLDAPSTYPVDYTITNTIHNTKGKEVKLHPIYAPVSDYASIDGDMVIAKADGKKTYDSIILGIPASITGIGHNGGDQISPFQGNTSIRMIIFENGAQLEYVGNRAFQGMAFNYAEIPASVETLAEGAYADYNDGLGSGALLSIEENSSLKTIVQWAFSGCGFKNIIIPANVESIAANAFIDCDKTLENVIFEKRNNELTLIDGIFNQNNIAISSIYIPENITLSANTFGGMSIGTIVINGQENTSEFSDASPWGANCTDIRWLIENEATAIASNYPTYLVSGETFSADLQIIAADGTERLENGVEFTAPGGLSGEQPFTLSYQIDGQDVEIEFTTTFVDAKVNKSTELLEFLNGTGKTAYISDSFTTDGFSINRSITLFSDGKEIGVSTPVSESNGYIVITADDVTLKGISFYPAISENSTENYIISASGKNLIIENVTLDNSGSPHPMVGGGMYFNGVSATISDTDINGSTMQLLPVWLEGSTVAFTDCVFGQNGGSHQWGRLMLAGDSNDVTITNNDTTTFNRLCVSGDNNNSDNISINWAEEKPWEEATYILDDIQYTYYDPTKTVN